MSAPPEKKKRGVNFSVDEQMVLLEIVAVHKGIVENKSTNATTWREKDEAWDKITRDFNSQAPNQVYRSKESLKKLYENQKKKTKTVATAERRSLVLTGGGDATEVEHGPLHELTLTLISQKSVSGLENKFDNDVIGQDVGEEEFGAVPGPSCMSDAETDNNVPARKLDWGDYKTSHLRTPKHQKLVPQGQSTAKSGPSGWKTRRTPTSASNSADLSKSYLELAEIKLQLAKLQHEQVQVQAARDKELHELRREELLLRRQRDAEDAIMRKEEWELRKQNLILDHELKKAQLQKFVNSL